MTGLTLSPDPQFADDDGSAAPVVSAALAAYGSDPDRAEAATLAVLQSSRVLVPVVEVPDEVSLGEPCEGSLGAAELGTVLMRGQDGRLALLAFTCMASLTRFDPAARPMPFTMRAAAEVAQAEGADAIVVDVAGPDPFVVDSADVASLVNGETLLEVDGGYAWVVTGAAEVSARRSGA